MKTRRNFIKSSAFGAMGVITTSACSSEKNNPPRATENLVRKPTVISTWNHGMQSNEASWKIIESNGTALDAVESGVRVVESDPTGHSVGIGGAPDRDGKVTLDACIMNHQNKCGAVAFLENIENPVTVARKVMEETPHVMLVGEGAYRFAREQGIPHQNLLTAESEKMWKEWLKTSQYEPEINVENHDTIGALALDRFGNLAGACTTSGMAYKMRGRVGDSPIIGAGLFVDNEVGAACATGLGEAIVRVAGSAVAVELMRAGKSPQDACEEVINRIMEKHDDLENIQVGLLALDKFGNVGAHSIYENFNYALTRQDRHELVDSPFKISY